MCFSSSLANGAVGQGGTSAEHSRRFSRAFGAVPRRGKAFVPFAGFSLISLLRSGIKNSREANVEHDTERSAAW